MERLSVLCLLLLFCSLSGAEHQDIEVTEQRGASPESANVGDHPQPCPPDVHAVLREMSAKLAENRLMIQQLQTLNQEQGVKLKELEKQTGDVETLKQQQQEHAAKLREVDPMKEQLRGQAAELNSLKTRTNVTENHVDSLRRDRAVGQVAFSASLFESGGEHVGPFNAYTTLVFRQVISNIGNAYNRNTGFFVAPVRGAYHFEFYIHGYPESSRPTAAILMKNGQLVVSAYESQTGGNVNPANGATLLLEAGDVVFVRQWINSKLYDNANGHCTFSGHLLFLV